MYCQVRIGVFYTIYGLNIEQRSTLENVPSFIKAALTTNHKYTEDHLCQTRIFYYLNVSFVMFNFTI